MNYFFLKENVIVLPHHRVQSLSQSSVSGLQLNCTTEIAVTLILPAAQDVGRIILGESDAVKLSVVPLSNDMVGRMISELANDVKEQLIQNVRQRS